jgi:hypothetical protein
MKRTMFATLLLIASALSGGGCTKTVITRIARHEIGGPPVVQPARTPGVYKVKWAGDSGKFKALDGTECLVWKGDHVGFEPAPDGRLIAFAGRERIPLLTLPQDARSCVWYSRQKRQTQFGREVDKALTTTGDIAAAAATGALLTGVVALDLYLQAHDGDDDDDCFDGHSHHHRSKHHGHHNSKSPPSTKPSR